MLVNSLLQTARSLEVLLGSVPYQGLSWYGICPDAVTSRTWLLCGLQQGELPCCVLVTPKLSGTGRRIGQQTVLCCAALWWLEVGVCRLSCVLRFVLLLALCWLTWACWSVESHSCVSLTWGLQVLLV